VFLPCSQNIDCTSSLQTSAGAVWRQSNGFTDGVRVVSGTTDKIKGRVKEAAGALTNDQRLKDEGRLDQAAGKQK
jgi:hypothetical protein